MTVKQYLNKKYGFSTDAKVPTSSLQEELLLDEDDIKQMVKKLLKRKTYPPLIDFCDFCLVCTYYLTTNKE